MLEYFENNFAADQLVCFLSTFNFQASISYCRARPYIIVQCRCVIMASNRRIALITCV